MTKEKMTQCKNIFLDLILNEGLKWHLGRMPDGRIPSWFLDLREILLTPEGSRLAIELLYEKIKDLNFDVLAGPSLAAEPIIPTLLLRFLNDGIYKTGCIVRKERGSFGLKKLVEGPSVKGKNVILIDDAMNSGGSMQHAVDAIEQEGGTIAMILTLVDFVKQGNLKFRERGYKVVHIYSIQDLGFDERRTYSYQKIPQQHMDEQSSDNNTLLEPFSADAYPPIERVVSVPKSTLVSYSDGRICCFNNKTRQIIWEHSLGEKVEILYTDSNEAVIFAASGLRRACLFFLSVLGGTMSAQIKLHGSEKPHLNIFQENYLLCHTDGRMQLLEKGTKKLLWEIALEKIPTKPAVDEKNVYVASELDIISLDHLGTVIWKKRLGLATLLAVGDNSLFVSTRSNFLVALNKENGRVIWIFETKNVIKETVCQMKMIGLFCEDGYLIFIGQIDGKVLQSFKIAQDNAIDLTLGQNQLQIFFADKSFVNVPYDKIL